MSAPTDDARHIERRTAEVEREIEQTRARIAALVGDASAQRSGGRFTTAVERDVRFDDATAAAEALLEGMHRETGVVGAITTRDERIEWKPFDDHRRVRQLHVSVECGAAPSLRLRGGSFTSGTSAMFVFSILMTLLAVGPVSGALGLSAFGSLLLALALVGLVSLAAVRASARVAQRRLRRMADRLGRRIASAGAAPHLGRHQARVALGEEAPRELEEAEGEQAEEVELDAAGAAPDGARRGLP